MNRYTRPLSRFGREGPPRAASAETAAAETLVPTALEVFENPRVAVVEAALLSEVASREEIGLRILDHYDGIWDIPRNSLYAYLKDLVAEGILEYAPAPASATQARSGRGRPTSFYFRVTPLGKQLYAAWRRTRANIERSDDSLALSTVEFRAHG